MNGSLIIFMTCSWYGVMEPPEPGEEGLEPEPPEPGEEAQGAIAVQY